MDLLALALTLLGLGVVARGHLLPGALLTVVPLLVLAIALGRGRRSSLILPFTFGSWFIVLPVAIIAVILLQYQLLTKAESVPLGLALYYHGGISLVERRARYTPRGSGFAWRTATRAERPVAYWLVVGLSFLLSGVFLALALASLSGRVGPIRG